MARLLSVTAAAFGLLAPASALSQPAIDWSKPQTLKVILIDDRFVPDRLVLQHGVPYRLHLENHGKELHEFTAPEFFAASTVRDRGVLANGGQDIVVQRGAVADVDIVPMKAGSYRLICADHDWGGMIGQITVE